MLEATLQGTIEQRNPFFGAQAHMFQGFAVGRDQPGVPARPLLFQAVADALVKFGHVIHFQPLVVGWVGHEQARGRWFFQFFKRHFFHVYDKF